jgi:hypothetical protein
LLKNEFFSNLLKKNEFDRRIFLMAEFDGSESSVSW